MKLKPEAAWFLAFTAVFAVLAGFVFWGTWSVDFAPIMPDHPITWPGEWRVRALRWWGEFLKHGRFEPLDFFVLVGSPYVWQEFKYAFCLYLSGLGAAMFLKGRGLASPAAYAGGLLLAWCGYWCTLFSAGHYGWFQWMAYGTFAFAFVDRALERGRAADWLMLGALLAWGSMRQPDLWLLFTVFAFGYFVFRWLATGRKLALKGWALGAAAFFAIGAPGFFAAGTTEVGNRDQQIAESGQDRWTFVTNWSMPPEDTLEFFIPRIHGDTSCQATQYYARRAGKDTSAYTGRLGRPMMPDGKEAPRGNYRQHSLYVGFVTCLLALAGVAMGRKDKTVRFFLFAGIVFYLFSLGRYCEGVYRLVFALPMGDYLRAPVKWHHLTEFCIVVLAAYGADALWRKGEWWRYAVLAAVLVGAADLARVDAKYCAPVPIAGQKYRESRDPKQREVPPFEPSALAVALGTVSVLSTFGVLYGAFPKTGRRHT